MIYIYTNKNCRKCDKLKLEYKKKGIGFIERDADRLSTPQDVIDQEANVEAAMQNMELPVVVKQNGQ